MTNDPDIRETLATGCRILADAGQEHFQLGHISARANGTGTIWLKAAGIGLGEVAERDFVGVGIESGPEDGAPRVHQEWPIHTEIYRERPDVMAVVHTHPLAVAAFSASSGNFKFVSQDSLLFPTGVGTFTDPRLVTSRERGRSLARALGRHSAVILRNHGLVTVGHSAQEAVVLAVSLDRSLQIQGLARSFGVLRPIDPEAADEMIQYFHDHYPGRIDTIWGYLDRRQRSANIPKGFETRGADVPRSLPGREGEASLWGSAMTEGSVGVSSEEGIKRLSDDIASYHQKGADLQTLLSDAVEPALRFSPKAERI